MPGDLTAHRRSSASILPAGLCRETTTFRANIRAFLEETLSSDWISYGALEEAERHEWFIGFRRLLVQRGLMCVSWPVEYGGQGRSVAEHLVLAEEFVRAGVPMQSHVDAIGMYLLAPTVLALGTEQQKREILPRIVSGEVRFCQGYSEPEAGSDLAAVRTFAELVDGQWVVNGQKIWTTSAHEANWIFLLARTDRSVSKHAGLTFLLLPMDQPGVQVRPLIDATGRHHLNQVFFTDAVTAESNVVGQVNDGWAVATALLGFERGDSAVRDVLNLRDELSRLTRLARERAATRDPVIRSQLAQAHIDLEAITAGALRGLTRSLQGLPAGPETSLHKLQWSEYHQRATTLALEILGEDALTPDGRGSATLSNTDAPNAPSSALSWVQTYLAARAGTIYAGTSEIQRNIVAERVLGLPRSPRPAASGPSRP